MFQKTPPPASGDAASAEDEYGQPGWADQSNLVGPGFRGAAEEAAKEEALNRILGRNSTFKERLERSVFVPEKGNVGVMEEEDDL